MYKLVPPRTLKPHERIKERHLNKLLAEIRLSRYIVPIIVDARTKVILDGHHRCACAKKLRLKRIPAYLVDYESPKVRLGRWRENIEVSKEEVIAMRPSKYSNKLIKETREFVINVPTIELLAKIDYCGTHSGRSVNKFKEAMLTPIKASVVAPPLIKECPINIECRLIRKVIFSSHDLFIGKVVAVHVDKRFLNRKNPDFSKLGFLFTTFLDYRVIGKKVGTAFKENNK